MNIETHLVRMLDWLAWALACYLCIGLLRYFEVAPQAQTILWKLGNLTVAAYAGYWIDRRAFRDRLEYTTDTLKQLRRAIVMAAAMLSVALGL